jgi:hypothetical protein
MAGAAALVGAGLARLSGTEQAEATHTSGGTANSDSNAMHNDPVNFTSRDVGFLRVGAVGKDGGGTRVATIFPGAIAALAGSLTSDGNAGRYGVLGAIGPSTNRTTVTLGDTATAGVWGINTAPAFAASGVKGLTLSGSTNGVWGEHQGIEANATGVFGTATATAAQGAGATVGVWGRSLSAAAGAIGTYGEVTNPAATGIGVKGVSPSGPGVFGTSVTAYGVQGLSTNAYGISGNSTTQAGVWGSSNSNVGVLGTSTSGVGVNGVSNSSNGVNGVTTSGIGVYGSSGGSGLAGRFDGNVVIQGNLTVSGTFPQTAAVPSADGTLRRVYPLGFAEAYYEDLGQGSLTNGIGAVTLDPEFAALVRTDSYQVFLTAYGDNRGLFVTNQTAAGFEVREVQGGTSSIGFGYRVIGRPSHGMSPRLDRVTLPTSPAQPKLDRIEPLDVPATLLTVHQVDKPDLPPGQQVRQIDKSDPPGQQVRVAD